jgi:hypothetical protein
MIDRAVPLLVTFTDNEIAWVGELRPFENLPRLEGNPTLRSRNESSDYLSMDSAREARFAVNSIDYLRFVPG